jgi:hypothetical protein
MPKKPLAGSLTVRLDSGTLRLVRARAKARRISTSDVVRELIEAELKPAKADVSALDLTKAWVGAIHDANIAPGASAREALAEWSPDRR